MKFDQRLEEKYELIQECPLPDIHSRGVYLRHKKSGARVALVLNDDPNKVFYIGFRTPPKDSTGVPHIIEHSVLCGSEKFPLKDPFIELAKGSLNTFLNAMTYPDKTMYPVASCNDQDFQNLMDVYLDAVLHPNIYHEENIFLQEGWRYELDEETGELMINGVVYNEMKGAFSTGDAVVERGIQRALYPDTPYCHESGGDPDVIPQLTYEEFLDFHATYYHPSNSYIYLYGDLDAQEKLLWLDEAYLSAYDVLALDSSIPLQKPLDRVVEQELSYSISSSESEEDNTFLVYSWSVGTNLDPVQYVAFDLLDYALLSRQGAPIKQALIDAGIGDDIYGGYDGGIYQPFYFVVAKNANPEDKERFCQVIFDTLTEQVNQGIDKTSLLAAINGNEFKFREADFGRFPKGLMFGLQMMDSWLYDDAAPFLHFNELAIYEELRQKLSTDYYENLIRQYLLDNTHAAILVVKPQKGLTAEKDEALREQLLAYQNSLSPQDIARLQERAKALADYQNAPTKAEDVEKIPLLSRADLKPVSDPYCNIQETIGDIPVLWHDYETNGIVYLDYLFDARHIPEEKLPYLSILKLLMGSLDTEEYAFRDLANEIHLSTGGIHPDLTAIGTAKPAGEYVLNLELRMRSLESNLKRTMELAGSMLMHTRFTDEKRIYELLAMTKSRLQTELRESGNSVAVLRALSYTSQKARCSELINGIAYYRVLERIVSDFSGEKDKLLTTLRELLASILQPQNLLISVTGRRSALDSLAENLHLVRDGLFANTEKRKAELSLPTVINEGFMDASQIQYVALCGSFKPSGLPYVGALRVFRCIMNYEYLWQNVRVRGGAYGCGCNAGRGGEIYFSSYRDPNLGKTLEVYQGVVEYLREFTAGEREMTRYVIGTFSEMDAPLTPVAQGRRSLLAALVGPTYEEIQQAREEVLAADQESIRALAPYLEAVLSDYRICAIGNEENLKQESALFGRLEAL